MTSPYLQNPRAVAFRNPRRPNRPSDCPCSHSPRPPLPNARLHRPPAVTYYLNQSLSDSDAESELLTGPLCLFHLVFSLYQSATRNALSFRDKRFPLFGIAPRPSSISHKRTRSRKFYHTVLCVRLPRSLFVCTFVCEAATRCSRVKLGQRDHFSRAVEDVLHFFVGAKTKN